MILTHTQFCYTRAHYTGTPSTQLCVQVTRIGKHDQQERQPTAIKYSEVIFLVTATLESYKTCACVLSMCKIQFQNQLKMKNSGRPLGHSSLADRMEDCSIGHGAVVWVRKPNFGSFCCSQPFGRQVWLSSGPPEMFTLSHCAWLWNWLINP